LKSENYLFRLQLGMRHTSMALYFYAGSKKNVQYRQRTDNFEITYFRENMY
jgi:hypothetical protein